MDFGDEGGRGDKRFGWKKMILVRFWDGIIGLWCGFDWRGWCKVGRMGLNGVELRVWLKIDEILRGEGDYLALDFYMNFCWAQENSKIKKCYFFTQRYPFFFILNKI